MKKLRVRNRDIGRWVTVKWDDIGRQDCLLVDVDLDNKRGKVFVPHERMSTIDLSQVTEIRSRLNAA